MIAGTTWLTDPALIQKFKTALALDIKIKHSRFIFYSSSISHYYYMLQEQIWLWDQAMILKFISANIGYQDQAFKINHIQSSNNFRCPQDLEKIEKNDISCKYVISLWTSMIKTTNFSFFCQPPCCCCVVLTQKTLPPFKWDKTCCRYLSSKTILDPENARADTWILLTWTAMTDNTSTVIRLNSSKQPQAPVWARPWKVN